MNFVFYFARRIMAMFPTIIGMTLVFFVMINLAPGSPIEQKLQQMRFGGSGGSWSACPEAAACRGQGPNTGGDGHTPARATGTERAQRRPPAERITRPIGGRQDDNVVVAIDTGG